MKTLDAIFKVVKAMRAPLLLIVVTINTMAGAPGNADTLNSIEWQRVKLEGYITEQIESNLLTILTRQQFIVMTHIKLKSEPKGDSKSDSTAPADTKESNAASNDYNNSPSKLGLDNKVADMIARSYLGQDKDLFKAIASVDVSVIFDTEIPKEKTTLALKLADRMVEITLGIKLKAKSETAQLVEKTPAPAEKKVTTKDLVLEFKELLGLLGGALVLTLGIILVAFLAFGKMSKFEKQKLEAFEAFVATQKEKSESAGESAAAVEAQATEASGPNTGHSESQAENLKSAIVKYKTLLNTNFPTASLLMKQWLMGKAPVALGTVSLIAHELTHEEWNKLLPELDDSAKKEFKNASSMELAQKDCIDALKFLNSQVLDSYLAPPPEMDRKILERLLGMNEKDCVLVLTKEPKLGAVMLNLLPVATAAKVLDQLPQIAVEQVTSESAIIENNDIPMRAGELANKLGDLLTDKVAHLTPFIERSIEMIPTVSASKEAALFKAIADSQNYQFLIEAAERFFPSALITKLSVEILRSALMRMPSSKRSEFIAGQANADFKTQLVSSMGEPGKKLRDLLDYELGELEKNEPRKKQALAKADSTFREFTILARSIIRGNEQAREETRGLLKAWYSELTGGKFDGIVKNADSAGNTAANAVPEEQKAA